MNTLYVLILVSLLYSYLMMLYMRRETHGWSGMGALE